MDRIDINGVLGSTFLTSSGERLLVERELGDGLLHIIRVPSGSLLRVEDRTTGEMMMPDIDWIEREVQEEGLRRIADENGPLTPPQAAAALLDREEVLAKDPFAEARWLLMSDLLKRNVDPRDPKLGSHIATYWDADMVAKFGEKPPTSTVRKWYGRCKDVVVQISEMMSMSGRVARANRIDPEVEKIIRVAVARYWANRGYKIVDVEAAVTTDVFAENVKRLAAGLEALSVPGKETIRRRVNAGLCRENYVEKYGEKAAKRKFDGSGRGITARRILQIGIMDDTVVDLVTCLDADRGLIAGRPYLCVLIDVHSRCVVGLTISFQPPSVRTAAESIRMSLGCVRQANRRKSHIRADRLARYPALSKIAGKFSLIKTDNGKNYVAPAFTEMLADLGIAHELVPVEAPRHKGIVERFFRSLNTYLIDKLPGATLDPKILRDLGIDPTAEAVVTIGELKELIEDFLYLYHISHHSGVDGAPLAKWQESMRVHGREMILDNRMIDIVTGVTVHGKRVTANGGVRMHGMTWKGSGLQTIMDKLAALEPHRRRLSATTAVTTKIKYDPEDLLHVHVFVGDDWIRLENTQPEYAAGLSLWQHRQIQDWAKRRNLEFNTPAERMAARDALNRRIREVFPDMDARERRAMARMLDQPVPDTPPVEFAEAEPRHDGMGPVIEADMPANGRADAQRASSRPPSKNADEAASDDDADADDHTPAIDLPAPDVTPTAPDDDDLDEQEFR